MTTLARDGEEISQHDETSQPVELSQHNELEHHGDFDADEAAMLQDMARNGPGAPEAQMYSYPDTGANGEHLNGYNDGGHSHGVVPASNTAYMANHTYYDIVQTQQDLDSLDPAALLESLANFEHPVSHNNAPISNDHFASLLQAAATAGGQEETHSSPSRRITRQSRAAELYSDSAVSTIEPRLKSRRTHQPDDLEESTFISTHTKRSRAAARSEDEDQIRLENEIWGPEEQEGAKTPLFEPMYDHENPPVGASDARALGIHSAAALFRRPTTASKKYTRPPMSKLFTSLDLSPQLFLHLQGAAKAYMLDQKHPERRDCVGNRGKGDTDMVKLKLFACVESFLVDEGWGDRCFGIGADGGEHRKYKWPNMKNKIISLVTPLLRRMVTNERQRKYAVETRTAKNSIKGGRKATKRKSQGQTPEKFERELRTPSRQLEQERTKENINNYDDIDPKLDSYHYNLDSSFSTKHNIPASIITQHEPNGHVSPRGSGGAGALLSQTALKYHVNIIFNHARIRPKLMLDPTSCPGFPSLVQHVQSILSSDGQHLLDRVQVLGVHGLIDVDGDEAWWNAIRNIQDNDWMEGDVRVVVEVK